MADLVLPPRDVGERQTLLDMLDYYRKVLIRKADGLTTDQLQQELAPSDLTIGRLLRHMALVEDIWFHWRFLDGGPLREWGEPYQDSKIEAEKWLWRFHRERGLPVTHRQLAVENGDGAQSVLIFPSCSTAPGNGLPGYGLTKKR